jgi:hypothetical protein
MTNLQVLQGSAGLNYPIDDETYEANLVKNGLLPTDTFIVGNQRGIDLAISDLALTLIFSAKKISDDGYSVELQSIDDLWDLRWWYRHKWGLPDDRPIKGPVLRDRTGAW